LTPFAFDALVLRAARGHHLIRTVHEHAAQISIPTAKVRRSMPLSSMRCRFRAMAAITASTRHVFE
jgi:hypothetical protein